MSRNRMAVDVGGTFTDVVGLDEAGSLVFEKVPTTSDEPAVGVIDSFDRAGVDLTETALFTHGTTLGLNALLTRTGARTAVVATRGFRDVYLLGRTAREGNYDIRYRKPAGLVQRADTFEVSERMLYDGTVHTEFDEADALRVSRLIGDAGYEAVAIGFLHSYANPAHEQRMRDVLLEVAPGLEVSLSSDLSREYREYERTSTAVLDAYTKPIVRTYLDRLSTNLEERSFAGQFHMMRSGGGAMTASEAANQPVNLILSGPAGGVIGAAGFAELVGEPNLVTIDMGGTSLDASLIVDGRPVLHHDAQFEGLPINTSSLYIHTIGAGGGSIAWIDEAGGLQVGPQSAGAQPGPASYGSGGSLPTLTDAALVVGYLGSETPLGGTLTLERELAETALAPIADEMGLTLDAVALGIVQISATKVMGAVRSITIELGRDPKDFSLLAFGGGGGLVATSVARELGISKVVIPPGQGAFSALGMLMADVQHDFARTSVVALDSLSADEFETTFAAMAVDAAAKLASEGFEPSAQGFARSIDLRYMGQEHSVSVELPDDVTDPVTFLGTTFAAMHEAQYGHTMEDPVQVTTVRLRATGRSTKPDLPKIPSTEGGPPTPIGHRMVLVDPTKRRQAEVLQRDDLRHGDAVSGPAIVVEHTATTVLATGDEMVVGPHGELIITVKDAQ